MSRVMSRVRLCTGGMDLSNRLIPALRAEWVELRAASWSNELLAGGPPTAVWRGGVAAGQLAAAPGPRLRLRLPQASIFCVRKNLKPLLSQIRVARCLSTRCEGN